VADLYLDENIPNATVGALQRLGHTAVHVRSLGAAPTTGDRRRTPDWVHLATAAAAGRTVVTEDGDFVTLHRVWLHWTEVWGLGSTRRHAGILRVPNGWTPAQTAQAIHDFFQRGLPITNRLYRWTPGGWEELG
jgi:Domain of unknown function (DUF5615)